MNIMHISDLHFGMNNPNLISVFLQEVEELKPEIIIISGDLTQRAMTEQFEAYVAFAEQLPGIILPVPGNHDIPLHPHQIFSRLFFPFKQYTHYVHSDNQVQFKNDRVRILGVNSVNPYRVTRGRLSTDTMRHIQSYFAEPFDGLNILFFHHNFDKLEGAHKPLENFQELIDYLKDSTIDIVCAGHSHYANINLIQKNNQKSCVFLHAGSLLCTRSIDGLNSYYHIQLAEKNVTVNWRVFKNNSFPLEKSINFNLDQLHIPQGNARSESPD